MLTDRLLNTSRGRIVLALRRGERTADEIAATLGLTTSAVRMHLTAMERDGMVQRVGQRPGTTRPSHLFVLTAEAEQLLSRAYIPLLTQILGTCSDTLAPGRVNAVLRAAGKGLARQLLMGNRPTGPLDARARFASQLLNERLGALTRVEHNGALLIRGVGCPVSALTAHHPAVCLAIETLVSEIVGTRARECCERTPRPRCCFEIGRGRRPRISARTRRAKAVRKRRR